MGYVNNPIEAINRQLKTAALAGLVFCTHWASYKKILGLIHAFGVISGMQKKMGRNL